VDQRVDIMLTPHMTRQLFCYDVVNMLLGNVIICHLFTLNLKVQFTPHEEHRVAITNVKKLMLKRQIIAVCCKEQR